MATTAQPRRTIDAYDDRVSAMQRERYELVRSVIATHGMHPDAWPTEALDRIAAFDGRVRALELLKAAAISVSVSWGTKPV